MKPEKPNFKQRLIAKTGAGPDEYVRIVLSNTLPLHAKILRPIANFFSPDTLAADYDLIADIGMLTSRRQFSDFVSSRRFHPANRGGWRKVMKVRVSIDRLQDLVYDVMRPRSEIVSDALCDDSMPVGRRIEDSNETDSSKSAEGRSELVGLSR